jgi:5-methylcytosine-specific restriction enzyme B
MNSEEEVLKHFDGKPTFKEFRSTWSEETTTNFYRIVLAAHNAGLDWWHVDIGDQVRFGRKLPGHDRAKAVFGSISGRKEIRNITLLYKVGKIEECRSKPLTDKFVEQLIKIFD